MDRLSIANVTSQQLVDESRKVLLENYTFCLVTAFCGLIALLVYTKTGKKTLIKSRVLNGPPKLPILGSTHYLLMPGVDKLQVFLDWVLKYGPVFKLNMLMVESVVVNCPAMLQKMLSSSNPNHLHKQRFFYDTIFVGPLNGGLLASDVKVWASHRKVLLKAFTFKSQISYIERINSHTREMIQSMMQNEHVISDGANVHAASDSFADALHNCTIKTILDLALGFSSYTKKQIDEIRSNFTIAKEVITYRIEHPWLLLKPIWAFHPLKQKLDDFTNFYEAFIQNITAKKQLERDADISNTDDGTQVKSIVDVMMDAGMSNNEIMNEFCTTVVGGHESSSLTISFLFFYLALHPNQQKLCQEEVDAVFRNTKGSGDDVSMDDLCDMKHLERCLLETLRLLPAVTGYSRQITEPIKLDDDLELPAGTNIFISPWTLHRRPELYPDPSRFDPDRFLPENCKARHPYAFLPFSAGPRNCIGYKFGMMEMKVIAAHVIRNFDIYTGHTKEKDACLDYQAPTLHSRAGLKLFFKRRTAKVV